MFQGSMAGLLTGASTQVGQPSPQQGSATGISALTPQKHQCVSIYKNDTFCLCRGKPNTDPHACWAGTLPLI